MVVARIVCRADAAGEVILLILGGGFTGIGHHRWEWERNGASRDFIPDAAVMSSPVPPSRKTLLHLYAATLRASRGFSSYNFRNYFLARTKDAFRGIQVCDSPTSVSWPHALMPQPDLPE